jgi:hypothetical protein
MVVCSTLSKAQTFERVRNDFLVMNVITGGIISGVGSAIHKKKDQSRGKAFLIGFGKGCIGGGFTFAGKYLTYEIKENRSYYYGWPCKLLHATGASIIENGAQNKPMFSNFALDYGPFRIDISKKPSLRIMPFATAGIIFHFINGNKFDLKTTLQSGTFYFESKKDNITFINSIAVNTEINWKSYSFYRNKYSTAGHEIIHTYQQREWLATNSYYTKNKSRFFYLDVPVFTIPYLLGGLDYYVKKERYYSNPYELEAESLSRRNSMDWDDKTNSVWPDIIDLPY